MKRDKETTLVYSSERGRVETPKDRDRAPQAAVSPADGNVRLRREVKGRGGGTVIVISGLSLGKDGLKELAAALKRRCGCGGTVKEGIIEIQGDHRDTLHQELQSRGYRVKLAGG